MGHAAAQRAKMRFLYWFTIGALACFMITARTWSVQMNFKLLQLVGYGGLMGIGVAMASSTKRPERLSIRVALALVWLCTGAALHYWVYAPHSWDTPRGVLRSGLLWACPVAILWLLPQKAFSPIKRS